MGVENYQSCRTIGGAARVWIGKPPELLQAGCNTYYPYTLGAALGDAHADTTITADSTEDFTTIDKASGIMNLGYITGLSGEIVMAYDKVTAAGPPITLTSVEVRRGVSRLLSHVTGNEATYNHAATTNDVLRITHSYEDFTVTGSGSWTSHDTLDAVEINVGEGDVDERNTNQQGLIETFYGNSPISFTMRLPLNIQPKYLKEVLDKGEGAYPMIVHDNNATAADRFFKTVYNNLVGKKIGNVSVVIIPEQTARGGVVDLDGNMKLQDCWFFPNVALKRAGSESYNIGEQVVMELEGSVLFSNAFQFKATHSDYAWRRDHYPTLEP